MIFNTGPVSYPRSIIDNKFSNYLPLSGGIISEDLIIMGSLSAIQYLGLPPSGGEVSIIELSVFL